MFLTVPAQAQDAPPAKTSPAPTPKASQGATTPKTGQDTAAKPAAPAPLVLKTQQEKASYAIGANIGRGMKKDGVQIDSRVLSRGISDALAGRKLAMTDEEMQAALTTLQAEVRKKLEAEAAAAAAANKVAGDQFLAANKTKEGVVTLPSGLQYKILKAGTGPKPTATDQVECN
jgi:FKBP-type peptidyl-prolyl cis-trans isomerase